MFAPVEALEVLLDPIRLREFADREGVGIREARDALTRTAAPVLEGDVELPSKTLRRARAAGARGRRDVEQLCHFVERAGRLPDRQKDVFFLCVAKGLSLGECADHLGISRETVRVHLRRLRRAMRACS